MLFIQVDQVFLFIFFNFFSFKKAQYKIQKNLYFSINVKEQISLQQSSLSLLQPLPTSSKREVPGRGKGWAPLRGGFHPTPVQSTALAKRGE
jgi:hypothetical protein